MSKTDYIKITGILELSTSSEKTDITYNIEYSVDAEFDKSKMGVITLRLSDIMDTKGFHNNDIELIASQLVEQILVRERDEERTLNIFHFKGISLEVTNLDNQSYEYNIYRDLNWQQAEKIKRSSIRKLWFKIKYKLNL